MADAVVVKKRGRPRKVDVESSSTDTVAAPVPTKKTAKPSKSDCKAITTKAASAKRTTKKAVGSDKTDSNVSDITSKPSLTSQPARRKATTTKKTKPSVLEQATAFHTLGSASSENSSQTVDRSESEVGKSSTSGEGPSTEAIPLSTTHETFSLSSFLDDSYKEPTPEPPETSIFVDRSAFGKSSTPAIEDIIRGDGVTSLASLSRTEQATTRDRFKPKSSIAQKPVKTFQGYGLRAFPDEPQSRSAKLERLNIPPETYGSQSFRALKTSARSNGVSSAEPTQPAAMPPNNPTPTTISATNHKSFSTTSEAAARSRSPPASAQPRFPIRDLHQPQPNIAQSATEATAKPTTTSQIKNLFLPAIKSQSTNDSPRASTVTAATAAANRTPRTLEPPKPTQMTPQQLLRDSTFKSKRRQYLGLIVGIPVVLATSLEVYRRFGGAKFITDEPGVLRVEGVRARRGELPQGGLLGDGGLKSERQD